MNFAKEFASVGYVMIALLVGLVIVVVEVFPAVVQIIFLRI